MELTKIDRFFVNGFVFFGPLGNLIPIFPQVSSFRFYYIFIFVGVVYGFFRYKKNYMAIRQIGMFTPIICYGFISALLVLATQTSGENVAENPLIRYFLLIFLFMFTVYFGNTVRFSSAQQKCRVIFLYLKGYIVSLFFGYMIHIAFYEGWISFSLIEKIEVLPQLGYGMLRFAPGSYPNEYGIVSSFALSILTVLLVGKFDEEKKWGFFISSKIVLVGLYIFTLIALFLTTTRAAYIAYILCVLYLCFKKCKSLSGIRNIIFFALFFVGIGIIIQTYFYDILNIFTVAYESFDDRNASAYERFYAWDAAEKDFMDNWLLGVGFGTLGGIHNIYLQTAFEFGIVGVCLLLVPLLVVIWNIIYCDRSGNGMPFLNMISTMGIIHVLWFGMSNHNLNHHLTWFVVLLTYIRFWDGVNFKNIAMGENRKK